jgi:hypothetical protein
MLDPTEASVPAPRDAKGVSTGLPSWAFKADLPLGEILAQGGSKAGYSKVSTYMSCPEKSHLQGLGVRRKTRVIYEDGVPDELEATDLGSIMHHLLSVRVIHGESAAEVLVGHQEPYGGFFELPLPELDRQKLLMWLRTYDGEHPIEEEPFQYLAVEAEIFTDVGNGKGGSCIRSARYDKIVQYPDGRIFSLEHKTSARGGNGAINKYMPQFETQSAIWNRNPYLVEQYGPMHGIIADMVIKKEIPEVERAFRYISPLQIERVIQYLRQPAQLGLKRNPDGSFPRWFHSCWQGWPPCEYIELCHEDRRNDYEGLP